MDAEILQLQTDIRLLQRKIRRLSFTVAALVVLLFAIAAGPQKPSTAATMTVRSLSVVDANGTERVRIAAPLPDPIMLGKRFDRHGAVSGMLIFDAEGNERGGYVTDDGPDRGAAITLDEIMRAAVHIAASDRGEAHVSLSNGAGGYVTLSSLPDGPFLRIDKAGSTPLVLPAETKGDKQ